MCIRDSIGRAGVKYGRVLNDQTRPNYLCMLSIFLYLFQYLYCLFRSDIFSMCIGVTFFGAKIVFFYACMVDYSAAVFCNAKYQRFLFGIAIPTTITLLFCQTALPKGTANGGKHER